MKKKDEYIIISNIVSMLAIFCAASPEKIIQLLTGYLWDDEEAEGITDTYNCINGSTTKEG
jgi:hypothetical protein